MTEPPYYSTTTCPRCECQVVGLDGLYERYLCSCGWASPPPGEPIVAQTAE